MTKEPTLNDLTCALTAGVVRRVRRDLSEESDRAADELWAAMARGLSDSEADDLAAELMTEADDADD